MGPPAKPSESGFVGERTSSETSEISPQGEMKDVELARTPHPPLFRRRQSPKLRLWLKPNNFIKDSAWIPVTLVMGGNAPSLLYKIARRAKIS